MKSEGPGPWDLISSAALIGIHMVTCTFVGLAIGYFLEDWLCDLGWCYRPWILLFWLLAGIGAGFKNIIEEARRMNRQTESERHGKEAKDDEEDSGTPPQGS